MRFGRIGTGERVDMHVARRRFEEFVQVLRKSGEALLVIGFAAEAGHGDVVGRCLSGARANSCARGAACQDENGFAPEPCKSTWRRRPAGGFACRWDKERPPLGRQRHGMCARHTTPHFRRSSHSVDGSAINRKKMIGMFQSSFVSRTVIPASL